jgi:hypothetical protein
MLLTFTKPKFEGLIKQNIKQHTIRADKHNRWKVGMKIHFWLGNPRNTRGMNKPYQFGVGVVERIEPIQIYPNKDLIIINGYEFKHSQELKNIALNDGFESWEEMKQFFTENFVGKLIIWSNCVWS